jgi:hypothetical protein
MTMDRERSSFSKMEPTKVVRRVDLGTEDEGRPHRENHGDVEVHRALERKFVESPT